MERLYTSAEACKLVEIPTATLRSWRANGEDHWGKKIGKDYVYDRSGVFSLAIMRNVKLAGGTIDQGRQAAFWAADEIARWAGISGIEALISNQDRHCIEEGSAAHWIVFSPTPGNPIVTNNLSFGITMQGEPNNSVNGILVQVLDLCALAQSLPQTMLNEFKG